MSLRNTTTWTILLLAAMTTTILILAGACADQATAKPRAKPPCASIQACRDDLARARHAIQWQRREKIRAQRVASSDPIAYAIRLGSVVYGPRHATTIRLIANCESHGGRSNDNPTSSAGGPLQYLDYTWATTPFGRAGFDRYDAIANILQGFRHFASGGTLAPWYASRGCWG